MKPIYCNLPVMMRIQRVSGLCDGCWNGLDSGRGGWENDRNEEHCYEPW